MCYLATKSTPIFPLLECIMLDAYEVQLPEHKAWFKETREERFGLPMEQASNLSMILAAALSFPDRAWAHWKVVWH